MHHASTSCHGGEQARLVAQFAIQKFHPRGQASDVGCSSRQRTDGVAFADKFIRCVNADEAGCSGEKDGTKID